MSVMKAKDERFAGLYRLILDIKAKRSVNPGLKSAFRKEISGSKA